MSRRETLHLPGFRLPPHSHEHATVNFLLAGGFEEAIGGRSWEVQSSLVVQTATRRRNPQGGRAFARS